MRTRIPMLAYLQRRRRCTRRYTRLNLNSASSHQCRAVWTKSGARLPRQQERLFQMNKNICISPTPWVIIKTPRGNEIHDGHCLIAFCPSKGVYTNEGMYCPPFRENSFIMRAAPEMYECLLEAVEDKCRKCKASWYGECVTADGKDCEMVAKWKSVLAKAAGEVV